jgi:hypothetical protein
MKSLPRQQHSRTASASADTLTSPHQLQLSPCEIDSTGCQLYSGSCSCGEMTPTPAWGTEEIGHAHDLHTQVQTALGELRDGRAEGQDR